MLKKGAAPRVEVLKDLKCSNDCPYWPKKQTLLKQKIERAENSALTRLIQTIPKKLYDPQRPVGISR